MMIGANASIHPGVTVVKMPKILTVLPGMPTRDMIQMFSEDNVTKNKRIEKLKIKNRKLQRW